MFAPSLDRRASKYMWLGTDRVFEAFTFIVKETPHGVMQVHGYPYSAEGSTFIVEMSPETWRSAGFDSTEDRVFVPGESDEEAIAKIRTLFDDELGDHEIFANNSKWLNFITVRNERWHDGNIVLLGDAAHTAHFSIGSGTKLAMEDALALAACLAENDAVDTALSAYERERRPVVESTQRAAQASLEWFENIAQYREQGDIEFCFNLLTRSRRITYENLKLRDPKFTALVDHDFAARQGAEGTAPRCSNPSRSDPSG
ncbi:FAD-dependent monooxygenase [Microbacterium sp. NIBRBAC000506063]|uniref:FAD-dependent monooxygenase n=1 Tax=Microbacterium sp. NIBRBAC000506063 TaxID=2734618 RepID=UPI0021D42C57|nr:FAD-dependent monooxygenase [Microbacterium sp. NIBRBAC000506063]